MRTHFQIIEAAGGYRALAEAIGQPPERARFWRRRKAIPPEQWKAVAEAGIATLEELAEAAATKRAPDNGNGNNQNGAAA